MFPVASFVCFRAEGAASICFMIGSFLVRHLVCFVSKDLVFSVYICKDEVAVFSLKVKISRVCAGYPEDESKRAAFVADDAGAAKEVVSMSEE